MKIETILNALLVANTSLVGYENWGWDIDWKKIGRQRAAFRDRIIRMDARIAELEGHNYALNLYIEEKEMDSEKSLVKGREQ